TRETKTDGGGKYIRIPKCNFDVEIAVDSVRLMDNYDTLCLFSSDADFLNLIQYLRKRGKKIILVKGGHVVHQLMEASELVINAQNIKEYISVIKQKPGN
ncbi:MAG: NYN domain-containing protein, partial [bacterium]